MHGTHIPPLDLLAFVAGLVGLWLTCAFKEAFFFVERIRPNTHASGASRPTTVTNIFPCINKASWGWGCLVAYHSNLLL